MSKGKRDALILTIIGLILYGLIYYNFVLVDDLAKISEIEGKISEAESKKASLDEDLKNLSVLQRNVEMKNIQNERLEEYLMNEANLSDNIDYIDKLAKLFGNRFSRISIGIPSENTSKETSTKYYQFTIDVEGSMTYSEAMNLVNYIEGGTRKVKISLFNLIPISASEDLYSIKMKIDLFALNLANIDKVYEYSRKRFNNFDESNGVIFAPTSVSADTTVSPSTGSRTTQNIKNLPVIKGSYALTNGLDIEIKLGSYLLATQNFVVNGVDNQYPIKLRDKGRPSVKITFNDIGYNVSVVSSSGTNVDISGRISNDIIKMYVGANFPLDIPENQNLGADIQIINNSSKRVDLDLEDVVKRIKITDRNGNIINNKSDIEKVYII